ncbi:hypothetical protein AB0O82_33425 [Kitasatospora sp. NPDC088264]
MSPCPAQRPTAPSGGIEATLHPYRDQIRAIDEQMIEALKDDQQ